MDPTRGATKLPFFSRCTIGEGGCGGKPKGSVRRIDEIAAKRRIPLLGEDAALADTKTKEWLRLATFHRAECVEAASIGSIRPAR